MKKAVFFDLYNTLVRFWPPLDEIQQASCCELGLTLRKTDIRRGYVVADEYFNEANAEEPLALRSPEARAAFFAEYERRILLAAGVDVNLKLADQVWQMAMLIQKDFELFEDVLPALQQLKEKGFILGVVSNLRRDMNTLTKQLKLEGILDFCVTSSEVGAEKPYPPIFRAALDRANVDAADAYMVGDQYKADVQGAKAVGITPVLLDREGLRGDVIDCKRISSLSELEGLLDASN